MNGLINGVKKAFSNKNLVTVIGVIVILLILYFAYTKTLSDATQEISVPVAVSTIQPRTEITQDMIEYVKIPSAAVPDNVERSIGNITGKYSAVNTVIPAGSMFYNDVLVDKEDLPDASFTEVGDGEIPTLFKVNMESTYANSIYPGNKIDIYMKATDIDGKLMYGKLIENVEVLAVKDSAGRNVFENTSESRTPSYLIFGLKEEIYILLIKANYLSAVDLVLVPHGGLMEDSEGTQVSTKYLQDFINSKTVDLSIYEENTDEDVIINEDTDNDW